MSVAAGAITCTACGRSFAWKPEYSGRTLKCKCGQPIKAPPAVPAAAMAAPSANAVKTTSATAAVPAVRKPTAAAEDDFAKLQAEAEYELAAAPPPPPTQRRVTVAPVVAPATGGTTSPILGYAGAVRKPPPDEATQNEQIVDVYIPLGLLVAALIAYFIDARLQSIHNPLLAVAFVLIKSIVNTTLVLVSMLIGVKLIDLGLGRIGPAMLKIAAVALLPAAVGEILGMYTMFMVPWVFTIMAYFALMKYLFDMDLGEMFIVAGIMWVVQTWVSMLLVGALLAMMGASGPGSKVTGAVAGTVFSSPTKAPEEDANPTEFKTVKVDPETEKETPVSPKEIDDKAMKLISDGKLTEARQWLDPANTHHIHAHLPRKLVREQVDQLYAAGARKVYAADIENRGPDDYINQLLVELPDDATTRNSVLVVMDKRLGREKPSKDEGGRYLVVPVY